MSADSLTYLVGASGRRPHAADSLEALDRGGGAGPKGKGK
jgi:hypothetical protein